MTLLSMCQDVADEVGLPRPSSIASSTGQLERQMLALSKRAVSDVARLNWPQTTVDYTFDTVVDQDSYDAPTGFSRIVGDSVYLADQYYQVRGSLSAADFMRQKYSLPSMIGRYRFRVYGNPLKIYFTPAPTTIETVALEYITSLKVYDEGGVAIGTYAADTDYSRVPEEVVKANLKWRIKHAKGLDYSEDYTDYLVLRDHILAQSLMLGSMPVALRHQIDIPEVPDGYVPEWGFGV